MNWLLKTLIVTTIVWMSFSIGYGVYTLWPEQPACTPGFVSDFAPPDAPPPCAP